MADHKTTGQAVHTRMKKVEGKTRRLRYDVDQARRKTRRGFNNVVPRINDAEASLSSLKKRLAAIEGVEGSTFDEIREGIRKNVIRLEKGIEALASELGEEIGEIDVKANAAIAVAGVAAEDAEAAHSRLENTSVEGDGNVRYDNNWFLVVTGFIVGCLLAWAALAAWWSGWDLETTTSANRRLVVIFGGLVGASFAWALGRQLLELTIRLVVPEREIQGSEDTEVETGRGDSHPGDSGHRGVDEELVQA